MFYSRQRAPGVQVLCHNRLTLSLVLKRLDRCRSLTSKSWVTQPNYPSFFSITLTAAHAAFEV